MPLMHINLFIHTTSLCKRVLLFLCIQIPGLNKQKLEDIDSSVWVFLIVDMLLFTYLFMKCMCQNNTSGKNSLLPKKKKEQVK